MSASPHGDQRSRTRPVRRRPRCRARRSGRAAAARRSRAHGGKRDPPLGQLLEQRLDGGVAVAEAESVRDGDPALQSEGARALDDQADLPPAERAAVVQVDVDAAAPAVGDREDGVEMRGGVAVQSCRVDAPDERRARLDRRVEQVGGPGVINIPLCGNATTSTSSRSLKRAAASRTPSTAVTPLSRSTSTCVRISVGAVCAVRLEEGGGALRDRRQPAAAGPFVLDQRSKPGPGRVRPPWQSPERLVDVGMTVDEPWEHEMSTCVESGGFRQLSGVTPTVSIRPSRTTMSVGAAEPGRRALRSQRSPAPTALAYVVERPFPMHRQRGPFADGARVPRAARRSRDPVGRQPRERTSIPRWSRR